MDKDKDWIGVPEKEWEPHVGPSQDIYDVLKKNEAELISGNVGLDGTPFKPPVSFPSEKKVVSFESPNTSSSNESDTQALKKGHLVSDQVKRKAGILSSFLRELVAIGTKMGWNNSLGVPSKLFTKVKGAELKETVSLLKLTSSEEYTVFLLLKNDKRDRTEKEQAIRDALLKFAFPRC
ncbi:MAG: hypothetical protein AAB497_04020 [Patescibacteria group bacterium]